jgi:outer membrane protein assembly factor BamB
MIWVLLLSLQDADEVRKATGVDAGLAVHLGTTDGELEAALADDRTLVHGLALGDEEPARSRLRERGLYGLASVARRGTFAELPYGDDLVNLLVADLDALAGKGPSERELLRVLVPGGAAYLRRNGAWTILRKPRPAELDDWTHPEYGPEGNAVSRDRRVGPATALKWIDGYRWVSYSHNESNGFRSENGILLHESRFEKDSLLVGRDAFNGLARWQRPRGTAEHGLGMVVKDGLLYTHLKGFPLSALDVRTGRTVRTFDTAATVEAGRSGREAYKRVRELVFGGTLYQVAGKSVRAFDPRTGTLRWTYEDGRNLLFPVASAEEKRIFAVAEAEGAKSAWSRWPGADAEAVVCIDAESGRLLWRNRDGAGEGIGVLVSGEGRLLLLQTSGIGAYEPVKGRGFVAALRSVDGSLAWRRDYRQDFPKGSFPGFLFQAVIRDGTAYLLNQNRALPYDLGTGEPGSAIDPRTVNNRCVRPRATADYLMLGFGIWIDGESKVAFQNVARSDCATGLFPANGMTYTTPNDCHCFAQLRGFAGYASEAPPAIVPDERRLEPGHGRPAAAGGRIPERPAVRTLPMKNDLRKLPLREVRVRRATESPIRDAWHNNDALPYPETAPVRDGAREYVAVVNEHRLEAREGGSVAWSFTAEARISAPPLVQDGRVHVASHDGRVYALRAADGALQWSYLAALGHRWVVAYGQLESAWPAPGLALHDGDLCVAAGRHPELDGGIAVYRLDPATGRLRSKKLLSRAVEWFPADTKAVQGLQNAVINEGLRVADGRLLLFGEDVDALSSPTRVYKKEVPMEPYRGKP